MTHFTVADLNGKAIPINPDDIISLSELREEVSTKTTDIYFYLQVKDNMYKIGYKVPTVPQVKNVIETLLAIGDEKINNLSKTRQILDSFMVKRLVFD